MLHKLRFFVIILVIAGTKVFVGTEEPSIHGTKKADSVFQTSDGLAINGYDPIAYFQQQKPVKGKKEFHHRWMGATWRFVSAENRDLFAQNPEQYAPQYGGYCAYGMSFGYAAPTLPEAWSVVEGKLYLNYNLEIRKMWNQDIPGFIVKADVNWPKIPKKPMEE